MTWTLETFRRRREDAFFWLNATQFFGALNDNIFKTLIQMFLIGMIPDTKARTLAVATMLFALPYLFLTSYGGFLADRFSKKRVTVFLKYAELVIMALALLGFGLGSKGLLYTLLFLMSAQSALFSPTKYSILPELVQKDKLTHANGLLVMCSFLAIITGSFLAPLIAKGTSLAFISAKTGDGVNFAYAVSQLVCVAIAVAGILASHRVVPLRSANPALHPDLLFPRKMWRTWQWVKKDRELVLAMCGTWLFSMLAAFLQINLVRYGMDHVGLDEKNASFLFFFAAVGIAAGAWSAGRLSRRNIEFGAMPGGAFLLAMSTYVIGLIPQGPRAVAVAILIFIAGLGAGLFVVPLDTFMQLRLPANQRGEGLAFSSFLSWTGILFSGFMMLVFDTFGVEASTSFLLFSFPAMLMALVSFFTLKDFAFRLFVTCAVKLLYKVRTIGLENVPVDGAAVLIVNHASYFDSLLLCATSRRRIRFFMSNEIYTRWKALRKVFDLYGVIPVSPASSPRQVAQALRAAREALDAGFLVCVFAEGGITRTGTIRGFKHGYEHVLKGSDYPIIPVYLGGSWGTLYHYYHGQLIRRWFAMGLRRYKVTVVFGKKLPPTTDAFHVRQAVMELSCDYFNTRKEEHGSLGQTVCRCMRRNWRDDVATDSLRMKLTLGKTLVAATALARAIAGRVKHDDHIGILLPACCAGLIANLAAALLGRGAVNLNFTTAKAAFESSITQCKLRTILTSRAFLERFPDLALPEGSPVFVEDILKNLKLGAKLKCLLLARFAPFRMMTDTKPTAADSTAIVLFSSGSTGEPKGVMLSQHNVISMIESLRMMLATSVNDKICGALPLFHSFGIMGTVWYPLLAHIKVAYHTNPLDAATIIDIVREQKCTMIFGTPTFLSVYQRKATQDDFKSLRFVLAGAEKLKESLVKAYLEKYGIRPYEAYGATELSPGIAVSVPHGTGGGVTQEGWRDGRVGLPVPGMAMKVLNPDTGVEVKPGEPGLLYLKGPNLMLGYLGRQDLTDAVLKDGWYCTGDIAFIDEDGFVGLTDRLSRFSKIGGEMVPHIAVEEALQNAMGLTGPVLAVTGVPDERKGERLVVLYTPECGDPQKLWQALEGSELPNLWRPDRNAYYPVEAIPVLGTGKVDLAGMKKLAQDLK